MSTQTRRVNIKSLAWEMIPCLGVKYPLSIIVSIHAFVALS